MLKDDDGVTEKIHKKRAVYMNWKSFEMVYLFRFVS